MTVKTGPWSEEEIQRLKDMYFSRPKPMQRVMASRLNRSERSVANKIFLLRKRDRHDWHAEERIAFFDIEASNLKANVGNMISYAIKPLGGRVKYAGWTRKEAIDRNKLDRRIMKELIADLKEFDLIVTYYGTGFDNKFIRTRAMMLWPDDDGGFPTYGEVFHFDVYYAVRGNLALYNNRLATATAALGIEGKTPLPASIWTDARLGYPDAMAEIKEHNVEDVKILEELYVRLLPHVNITRRSI